MTDKPIPSRSHSQEVRERFFKAVEAIAAEGYPKIKVVNIVRELGVDPSNYYRLRRPGNYPTIDYCVELCKQHAISSDWLFMGTGNMRGGNKDISALELLKAGVEAVENELRSISKSPPAKSVKQAKGAAKPVDVKMDTGTKKRQKTK